MRSLICIIKKFSEDLINLGDLQKFLLIAIAIPPNGRPLSILLDTTKSIAELA